MKMKYRVGQKIRVIKDLESGKFYDNDMGACDAKYPISEIVVSEMLDFRGQTMTIESIFHYKYHLVEDYHGCFWTDEMFESVSISKNPNNEV